MGRSATEPELVLGQFEDVGLCGCGKQVYANPADCSVLHEHPYCDKFDELDPLEFIIWLRRAKGLPDPDPHSEPTSELLN